MPGFPDKFMPFMDEPPGSVLSTGITETTYGPLVRNLRSITLHSLDKEPRWRHKGPELRTGYGGDPTADDSVTVKGDGHPEYSGKTIKRGAERIGRVWKEAGRVEQGRRGRERPAGTATARHGTGVNPQDPMDDRGKKSDR
jgi:hypothetical protein